MVNWIIKGVRWGYKRTKRHDMFKHSISLTYKGNETISSWVGTVATLSIMFVSLTYLYMFLRRMFERTEVSWDFNMLNVEGPEARVEFNISKEGLLLFWENQSPQTLEYIDVSGVARMAMSRSEKGEGEVITPDCESLPPPEGHPNAHNFWLGTGAYNLSNGEGTNYETLVFYFSPWELYFDTGGSAWEDAQAELDQSQIYLVVNDHQVNLNSVSEPIKQRPISYSMKYEWGVSAYYTLYVSKNEIFMEDDLFPYTFSSELQEFYTYSLEYDDGFLINSEDGYVPPGMVILNVKPSSNMAQYRRKYMNIFEVLGFVGGIFEILEVTWGFLVGTLSYFMVKKDLNTSLKIADLKFAKFQKAFDEIKTRNRCWNCTWKANSGNTQEQENSAPAEENKNVLVRRNSPNRVPKFESMQNQSNEAEEANEFKPSEPCEPFEKFKMELNCIEILYAIKELKYQVNFLLRKDPDYAREVKKNPDLSVDLEGLNKYTGKNEPKGQEHVELYEMQPDLDRLEQVNTQSMGRNWVNGQNFMQKRSISPNKPYHSRSRRYQIVPNPNSNT